MKKLLEQYECGPIQFTGTGDALYERHLMFDNVLDPAGVGARERYEAVARSVQDVLSQRWLRTETPTSARTPSASTISPWSSSWGARWPTTSQNLLLDPVVQRVVHEKGLDWLALLEEEPDAGLGQWRARPPCGVLPRLDGDHAAPAMGYGLRYEYGIFRQTITMAGNASSRTTGYAGPIPGRSPGRRAG